MADDGLSLGYRISYAFRSALLGVFGPAELGDGNDPKSRLRAERDAKIAAYRARQAGQSGGTIRPGGMDDRR